MKPYVVMGNAVSLDGRIDWVKDNNEVMYAYYAQMARWKTDAIFVGSRTLDALGHHEDEASAVAGEKPPPNPPPPGAESLVQDPKPLLIVPDSRGRLHNWRLLQMEPWWRDILVLCTRSTPASYLAYLSKRQIAHMVVGEDRVNIPLALDRLQRERDIQSLRVDSGGALNGVFLEHGLVDEIGLVLCPFIAGANGSITIHTPPGTCRRPPDRWRLKETRPLPNDYVWLLYEAIRNK